MVNFVFQLGLDQIGESVATAEDAPAAAPHPPIARPQAGQVKSTGYLRSGQVRSGYLRLGYYCPILVIALSTFKV